ncbi:uncharacterized protein LOC120174903 [Hibiscus syriacus]|uniref:uncharacterized protein LOC120174903 n=1 Tax=Hibiscus syriacus TaxID=106335 RepID=UPI001922163B|nr:uncharacterized protein LOC120174903 [Hibiscus syriacus]
MGLYLRPGGVLLPSNGDGILRTEKRLCVAKRNLLPSVLALLFWFVAGTIRGGYGTGMFVDAWVAIGETSMLSTREIWPFGKLGSLRYTRRVGLGTFGVLQVVGS